MEASTINELTEAYQKTEWLLLPKLVLGKGSNVLFTEPFHGVVVINGLLGKSVVESVDHVHLHVSSGEDWPGLVEWTLGKIYMA